jgi:TrmH family RNA methyltransferase
VRRIASRQNPVVAEYRATIAGHRAGMLLLDGVHLVADALAAGLRLRVVLVAANALERTDVQPLVTRAEASGADVAVATAPVMGAVSPVRSPSSIVALAEHPKDGRVFEARPPLVAVACHVQDPGNLGAIARVAEAAGASGLLVAGRSANPFGWKALRGSMGSVLRFPLAVRETPKAAIAEARREGCRVVATVPRGGRSMYDSELTAATAVVVGSEGTGLDEEVLSLVDERITIPMQAPVESLNVAVTAAVVLYEARRQRR